MADVATDLNLLSITLVNSATCDGSEPNLVRIECGYTKGFAGMALLGNPSEVCRDGKERARAALETLGYNFPPRRLVISLAPADVRKDGNHFDLPLAVSLALLLAERSPRIDPGRWLFAAELGLGGELRPVKGVVAFAVAAMSAGLTGLVVAPENLPELGVLLALRSEGSTPLRLIGLRDLAAVLDWVFTGVEGRIAVPPAPLLREAAPGSVRTSRDGPDFDDMILTPEISLLASVVAAGMHSLLLRGPPGTGKSMLAARLPSILPNLAREQHIEALRIHSTSGEAWPRGLLAGRPPYRAPHHQASAAALLGAAERPGELALAHGGVLFLDELPEFRRDLLESLREPLETGEVRMARAQRKTVWKAAVVLIAACNNCPCGWYGSARRECRCGRPLIQNYQRRLSGPILDRIDLHVNMPESTLPSSEMFLALARGPVASSTIQLAQAVARARAVAQARNRAFGVTFNRDLPTHHVLAASGLSGEDFAAYVDAVVPRTVSSRTLIRCLRVARTLADLAGQRAVDLASLQQAWQWQAAAAAKGRGEHFE